MNVRIAGVGPQASIEAQVDPLFQALRASLRPLDHTLGGQILGHYRAVFDTGAVATPGAAAVLLAFRWGDTKNLAVLKRVQVSAVLTTVLTALQALSVQAVIARAFTVSATGGAVISLAGQNQKNRTNMGTSLVTDLRQGSAGVVTAGTRTLDAAPFGATLIPLVTNTVGVGIPLTPLYQMDHPGSQHPVIFAKDEGFEVQNGIAFPAAGAMRFTGVIEWAELAVY